MIINRKPKKISRDRGVIDILRFVKLWNGKRLPRYRRYLKYKEILAPIVHS